MAKSTSIQLLGEGEFHGHGNFHLFNSRQILAVNSDINVSYFDETKTEFVFRYLPH